MCFVLIFLWYFIFIQEAQSRCTDLDSERQRIQTEFESYYQRTQHLEEIQQHSPTNNNGEQINQVRKNSSQISQFFFLIFQNGLNDIETHGRFHVQTSLKGRKRSSILMERDEI